MAKSTYPKTEPRRFPPTVASTLFALLVCTCAPLHAHEPPADAIWIAIVDDIIPSPEPQMGTKNWVVSLRVERVESGTPPSGSVDFRIHSPARAGLEKGKRYRIHALAQQGGYVVDEARIEALQP